MWYFFLWKNEFLENLYKFSMWKVKIEGVNAQIDKPKQGNRSRGREKNKKSRNRRLIKAKN